MRHGRLLGIRRPFMEELCDTVIKENGSAYPELIERADYIKKVLSVEEERFLATLDSGLNILNGMMDASSGTLSGDDAFKLSDTFGFPIDLTREIAAERGLAVDMDRYGELLTAQKDRARAARAAGEGWKGVLGHKLKTASSEFVGYDSTECTSKVLELIVDGESVESVSEGEFAAVLDRTPFYAESGGQVGDKGVLKTDSFSADVIDTKKNPAGVFIHDCQLTDGKVSVGDVVTAAVDGERRLAIRRNHSSVHLLQSALREVLGAHVAQAGSYVDENRSRFDFTHFSAVTKEELRRVEDIVNSHVLEGLEVKTEVMDVESAKKSGATALFDEKYGDFVRVVSMGDVSKEFCGGTHIDNTARIGYYRIISESSVAAGVRRIEAASGKAALELAREDRDLLSDAASAMKVQTEKDICRRAEELGNEIKALKNEAAALGEKLARAKLGEAFSAAEDIKGLKVLTAKVSSLSVDAVRAVGDDLKADHPEIVAVIAVESGDKLNFVCVCGPDAVKAGVKAGALASLVGKITGGGGGGRPDCAVSGGKDLSKVDEALAAVKANV
ncbi:MAG: alanine--tRNA ligase [Clostridia bacterium]|nr:alanine--tRNA ligase [Clostridia bacterium]